MNPFYRTHPAAASEILCKVLIDISCENALSRIQEDSVWLQLIYFLTKTTFWFMKYLSPIDGDTLK